MISDPARGPERTLHLMQGLPCVALKSAIKFFPLGGETFTALAQACVLSAPTCIPD